MVNILGFVNHIIPVKDNLTLLLWGKSNYCVWVSLCVPSWPTLWDLMDCSPPGCSIHGTFQVRLLEWVAISSSRGSSWPRDWTCVSCISCIARQILYHCATWEAQNQDKTFKKVWLCPNKTLLYTQIIQESQPIQPLN